MGYICPDCGEGLPEDTFCPCTMMDGGPGDQDGLAVIRGSLTAEIGSPQSPVRQFLGERFTCGLRDVQRRYRAAAPPLAVPGAAPVLLGVGPAYRRAPRRPPRSRQGAARGL